MLFGIQYKHHHFPLQMGESDARTSVGTTLLHVSKLNTYVHMYVHVLYIHVPPLISTTSSLMSSCLLIALPFFPFLFSLYRLQIHALQFLLELHQMSVPPHSNFTFTLLCLFTCNSVVKRPFRWK